MERPQIDLAKAAKQDSRNVVARLEGAGDRQTDRLWSSEFAASGGKVVTRQDDKNAEDEAAPLWGEEFTASGGKPVAGADD